MSQGSPSHQELLDALRLARARVTELEVSLDAAEEARARLTARGALFRSVFDQSNDAMFVVELDGDEIVDVNPKACRMLGYEREELLAVPMTIIHPHEMGRVRAFADEVSRRGEGFISELTCVTKDRRQLPAELSGSIFELEGRRLMLAIVRDLSERERLSRENAYLQGELRAERGTGRVIGASEELAGVLDMVARVAVTDSTVLITGESGTGKELIAQAIHDGSRRAGGPFVRVNCPSIPAELFESEFFGHARGAFTGAMQARAGRFELADRGTIFLDEIGEIPLPLQSKLLRVLQEGEIDRVGETRTRRIDVRVVAATNRDLMKEVELGRFREDLYYRLSPFPLWIPPLRERIPDIRPLAEHFLSESAERLGVPRPRLGPRQLAVLEAYRWPGNVRELRNVIERATILSRGGVLELDIRPDRGGKEAGAGEEPAAPPRGAPAGARTLEEVRRIERDLVLRALEATDWKIYGKGGAAARLGVPPTTLASRMKKMGIRRGER